MARPRFLPHLAECPIGLNVCRGLPVPSVDLPFWLITERRDVLQPTLHEPCDKPEAAHGFTSVEKLVAFMAARGGAKWHVDQVADADGVIVSVAKLYERGVRSVCIDPESDGSGGLLVSLSDLLAAYGK
jgi:hypothetical protein